MNGMPKSPMVKTPKPTKEPKAPPMDAMTPSNAGKQAQSSDNANQYQ